jgi:oxygen-independent coproporphyrinogen-3 oxidase
MNKAVVAPASEDLLRLLDMSEPLYNSYPASDRFVEAFSTCDYTQALQLRRTGAVMASPLSIYIHIPFCESLCYYCTCNKIITKQHDRATTYLRYLNREIDLHIEQLGVGRVVTQMHLGGGTPAFLSDAELRSLMARLRCSFTFDSAGNYSIEIDPRTMNASRLELLAELGFNHLSLGVQDVDAGVQKAVNRMYPGEQVASLVAAARQLAFSCINIDLLYGLPLQSTDSFTRSLAQMIELRPQRITLHAYVHQPERFKPQRRIAAADLPAGADKVAMLTLSIAALINAGYVHVGVNHFALPTDALAIAKRQGRLHRNVHGYSTQSECDLIGFGASAISQMGATYSQNARVLADYYDSLDQGHLPVERGLGLSRDDLVRRAVIMSLMCHGEILYESIELAHLIDFRRYFASELIALQALEGEGLVTLDNAGIQVSSSGCYFVQRIAMVFDRYVQSDRQRARFSRII